MPRPSHGAVGLSFLGCRVLQIVLLIVVMSLTSKFIASIIDSQQSSPPPPIVGTLSVVCFAILYCIITTLLYWDSQLPLLPTAGLDLLFFIALMVSSIVIGKPLSYFSCKAAITSSAIVDAVTPIAAAVTTAVAAVTTPPPAAVPTPTPTAQGATAYTTTIANAAATVAATLTPGGKTQVTGSDGNTYTITGRDIFPRELQVSPKAIEYAQWIAGGTVDECKMMKAVWGLGIALTILFVFSACMAGFIWKASRGFPKTKKVEGDA